ncbi:chemotaxis protein CheW [Paludibacterium paludis]|uniref:CheW-like domain-containing protein n=1 Tax=Paludibacterium paludis TaxID=1225769 RepID=A0A918P3W3_9NEIS|nr:chemotaxis protein CheW [Paludibacterium paludis]GGY19129.1 hypothetical protein GCM10011289_23230 [Paludibacterium paludis]
MSASRYGVFSVGESLLALEIHALREVVPCPALEAMPGAHPGLKGQFSLRGTPIPVLDLRELMPACSGDAALCNVVIVATHNRLFGLLASGIDQVVECETHALIDADTTGILCAGFTLPSESRPVSVIAADRLAALPGLPCVEIDGASEEHDAGEMTESPPLMLMESGGVPLAMDATAVHTIILSPQIEDSPMKSGFCLGILRYSGLQIPVINLLGAIGLGRLPTRPDQAFIIKYPDGFIAFTVETIFDVAPIRQAKPVPIPRSAFADPDCIIGGVSAEHLPYDSLARQRCAQGHFLVVSDRTLGQREALVALARMTMPDKNSHDGTARRAAEKQNGRLVQVLTVDANGEVACPIDVITQIIPWSEHKMLLGLGCDHAGLIISREQAIPTYCLSKLLGVPLSPSTDTASVLVVKSEQGQVGFAVPRLITIDSGRLIEEETACATQAHPGNRNPSLAHITLGQGGSERILVVIDLIAMANDLLAH